MSLWLAENTCGEIKRKFIEQDLSQVCAVCILCVQ